MKFIVKNTNTIGKYDKAYLIDAYSGSITYSPREKEAKEFYQDEEAMVKKALKRFNCGYEKIGESVERPKEKRRKDK